MQLLGRYLSPFVRRVAVTLSLYDMPFEHNPIQHTGDDAPKLREKNPLGRVPALILDDGEVLVESAAILDHLDREVGPERALTPAEGMARSRALNCIGIATGAVEKAIAVAYESRFRPEEKHHLPWVERCTEQAAGGFRDLEGRLEGDWFMLDRMTQVDVTTAVCWQFACKATPSVSATVDAPRLDGLVERMMQVDAFRDTYPY